ncbi:MAG TPA: hypothetical protein VLB49_11610 [Gemmatimonadales bacterium]|nr:hypothetical protein [Gemmatimonadales bacterium]
MHRSVSTGLRGLAIASALVAPSALYAQGQTQVVVSGVGYMQYVYQLKDTANHVNNFDVTRAYVNAIGRFAGGVGARVTLDVNRPAGDNSLRYRLKYAFATYTPTASPLTFKLGMIHTPWVDFEETLWEYRMQGTTALDRNGYLTSSDLGVGVDGKWGPDKVNMQVAFVNGESYSGGPGDQRKDVEGRVSVRLLGTDDSSRVGGLRISGYGGYGKPTTGGQRNRFLGMLSYKTKQITLAGELATTKDSVTGTPTPSVTGRVITAFGVYKVPNSKIGLIARVDIVDPNTSAASDKQTRIIGGVSYQLSPNLRLLLDIDNLSYEGTPTPAQEAVRSQALFQTQITF